MLMGKPVVAFDLPNLRKIFTQWENGVLVDQNDARKYVEAIAKLARDKGLRKKVGENARRRAAEFDWDLILQRLRKELNEHLYGNG